MKRESHILHAEKNAPPPHIVFYNLTNSGASAIVPIIEELLVHGQGYVSQGDPSSSAKFEEYFTGEQPTFHWTHSPPSIFETFLDKPDFRFICLYRDPRDVLVSHIKDLIHRDLNEGKSESDLYHEYIGSNFDGMYHYADEWLHLNALNVISLSFEELKKDIPGTIRHLFKYLGLTVNEKMLDSCCKKYSFESVTKRTPGEDGPIVRNNLMYRKGISGDWKNQFDEPVEKAFNKKFELIMNRWGYGKNPSIKEYQIVSPPMPCGVGWLVNVLLELGIRTNHHDESYVEDHWQCDDAGREQINPSAKEHLQWHLPVLNSKQSFEFQDNINVRWEHRLDFGRNPRPTILFTRDVRDAVYSQYRRHHEQQCSFDDYLAKPDQWPDHFPGMFDLPPAETWALFNFFWLELANIMPLIVVRFEDTKENPVQQVQRILKFLDVSRTKSEIHSAVEKSSFSKAHDQERSIALNANASTRNNHRKGMPYEWKTHYDRNQLIRFSGMADEVLHRLGYETTIAGSAETELSQHSEELDSEIQMDFKSANLEDVRKNLLETLAETTSKESRNWLCSQILAHDWVQHVFKIDLNQSLAATRSRKAFSKILARYAETEIIQNLFSKNIRLSPVITPLGSHRGYVLVQVDRSYLALSPALGPEFDILEQSQDSINDFAQQGLCIVVATENRLIKAIDLLIDSILDKANGLISSGQMQAGAEVIKRCISLTGAKDAETIKVANYANQLSNSPFSAIHD